MNGARNAPARPPQETPIIWAMNAGGLKARATEMTMKTAISTRMTMSWVFSLISCQKVFFRKSRVIVELEVRTSDDSVDMEADRTRTMTMPMRISGSVESMDGMMASKAMVPSGLWTPGTSPKSLPKPPRK